MVLHGSSYTAKMRSSNRGINIPVSLTFDGGRRVQYTKFYPILREYKIRATFYVNTNKIDSSGRMSWNELKDLYNHGNEIGSHTHTHTDLTRLSDNELDFELRESKTLLMPFECKTLAYPYGKYNRKVIDYAKKYYITARGYCDVTVNSKDCGYNHFLGNETYKLKVFPTEHFFPPQDSALFELTFSRFKETVKKIVENGINKRLWIIFVFHGQHETNLDKITLAISNREKLNSITPMVIFRSIAKVCTLSNMTKIMREIMQYRDSRVRARDILLKFKWMCEYLTSNDNIEVLTVSEVAKKTASKIPR